jgi:hypothetical protein
MDHLFRSAAAIKKRKCIMITSSAMQIETDLTPIRSALHETGELVRRLLAPPETIEIIRERLFGNPNTLDEFVAVRTKISGAVGAQRMCISYEPSNILFRLMSALRAGQYEFLTLKSHDKIIPISDLLS